jgi:hypothetical protein
MAKGLESFLRNIEKLGLPSNKIIRIEAISTPGIGYLGCSMSHIYLWNKFLRTSNQDWLLVLEDDIGLNNYNDNFFNIDNYGRTEETGFLGKLISHVILSTDILLGKKIVLTGGYNFLKRKELRIQNFSNGLTGFSYGITLKLQRLDFCFSRSNYQVSLGYNQVGLTYRFRKSE